MHENELCRILKICWASAREKNRQYYKVNAFKGLRFALQRYFLEVRGLGIINQEKFREANTVLVNALNYSSQKVLETPSITPASILRKILRAL